MNTIKKIITAALLAGALAGCTTSTVYGDCIGVFDDKDPRLVYKLSAWNLFVGVIGLQLIVPPVIVLANETFCPVGKK